MSIEVTLLAAILVVVCATAAYVALKVRRWAANDAAFHEVRMRLSGRQQEVADRQLAVLGSDADLRIDAIEPGEANTAADPPADDIEEEEPASSVSAESKVRNLTPEEVEAERQRRLLHRVNKRRRIAQKRRGGL